MELSSVAQENCGFDLVMPSNVSFLLVAAAGTIAG